jgi:hypothetical protein
LYAKLESALSEGTGDRVLELEMLDGEGKIYVDKTPDYILIRLQGSAAFQLEPYYLKLNKSGIVESRPGLGVGNYYDNGVMLRKNCTYTGEAAAAFDEHVLVYLITQKLNGEFDGDIATACGYTDYVLSKPL